ncbi:GNAT family N-acetyltransferase [Streptosporangiaceae bacterium NEAU-GS5]|nr:GNAT family N-acetyltransferase [Streptosporangiaceae bacterium NEAU-GS5]
MQLEQVDFDADDGRVAAFHEIHRLIDEAGPRMTLRHFTSFIRYSWSGDRAESYLAIEDGEVAGGLVLEFPDYDNTHAAMLRVLAVAPPHRRRGIGDALLQRAIERARAEGRRLLIGESDGAEGEAFAKARGFELGITSARRVLDVGAVDWHALELGRAEAARHATAYVTERWVGPAPKDRLDDMVVLMTTMNEAPFDDLDIEDEVWDVARWRRHEEINKGAGLRTYTMIARHGETGEPAGFTRLLMDPGAGDGWAWQADTAVVGGHRGHRLGTVLKLANLAWFHACEPSVERIVTWNAASNSHMVGINEAMGYRLLDLWYEWQLPV